MAWRAGRVLPACVSMTSPAYGNSYDIRLLEDSRQKIEVNLSSSSAGESKSERLVFQLRKRSCAIIARPQHCLLTKSLLVRDMVARPCYS
jgi:hypothetical protein